MWHKQFIMDNIKWLRDEMIDSFKKLKDGKIGVQEIKAECTAHGVILKGAKLQLEYNKYAQSKKEIKFLDSNE